MTTPDALGGGSLTAWFKADAGIGVADGAAMTGWNDSSSGARNLTSVVGAAPKYRAAGGPNNMPYVDHTVSAGGLAGTVTGMPGGDFTFFVLCQVGTLNSMILLNSSPGAGNTGQAELSVSNQKVSITKASVVLVKTSTAAIPVSAWTIVVVTFTSIGSVVHFDIGGTIEDYSVGGTTIFDTNGLTYGEYNGTGNFFNGVMAEIGVYDSVLSSGDLASLKAYLNTKYFTAPHVVRRPTMTSRVAVQQASRW